MWLWCKKSHVTNSSARSCLSCLYLSGIILSPGSNPSLYEQGKANTTSILAQQAKIKPVFRYNNSPTVEGQEGPVSPCSEPKTGFLCLKASESFNSTWWSPKGQLSLPTTIWFPYAPVKRGLQQYCVLPVHLCLILPSFGLWSLLSWSRRDMAPRNGTIFPNLEQIPPQKCESVRCPLNLLHDSIERLWIQIRLKQKPLKFIYFLKHGPVSEIKYTYYCSCEPDI